MNNLTLDSQFNTLKPVTTCSLAKPVKSIAKDKIIAGMSPKQISSVVSDHLINVVKQQFEKK
ncbi:hypothetical protein [Flavobacterium terrigena]|uniref:Uncharacterized protein n=1 Tax=Flavobacterium terrigena TaxID=402734 RepID=A0A1H6T5D8_9FLAO|nr:hypothetical protein [Flavobacterium terrigena]SEI70992.1 hypothetical protein SAMN05660918_1496 [Flavobacterium terrigena]